MNFTRSRIPNSSFITRHLSLVVAAFTAAAANAATTPEVSSVTMEQSAATREVTITYALSNAPAVVTLDIQTNATVNGETVWTSIGGEHIWNAQGDVWKKIDKASGVITWRPDLSWPDRKIDAGGARAVVTAWAVDNTPDYMVVDISSTALPNTQKYYPSVEFLPGSELGQTGAVTNNPDYKTSKLVMRKIMAKGVQWTMGALKTESQWQGADTTHLAQIPNNYYIGIFEITQGQWSAIATNSAAAANFTVERTMRPMEMISYNEIRNTHGTSATGTVAAGAGGVWPDPPSSDSFLGLLRLKTGIDFDMPGAAQWEFACRAGHGSGYWGDGSSITYGAADDPNLAAMARTRGLNNPSSTATTATLAPSVGGTAIVGSFAPNSWGLYDMHGNVAEPCLDWFTDIDTCDGRINIDPADPTKTLAGNVGTYPVFNLGSYNNHAIYARPAARQQFDKRVRDNSRGLRVVCTAGLE